MTVKRLDFNFDISKDKEWPLGGQNGKPNTIFLILDPKNIYIDINDAKNVKMENQCHF